MSRHATRRPDGLSETEGTVMDHLRDAVDGFAELPAQHPQEQTDFIAAVRHAQGILATRACRSAYPDGWPVR